MTFCCRCFPSPRRPFMGPQSSRLAGNFLEIRVTYVFSVQCGAKRVEPSLQVSQRPGCALLLLLRKQSVLLYIVRYACARAPRPRWLAVDAGSGFGVVCVGVGCWCWMHGRVWLTPRCLQVSRRVLIGAPNGEENSQAMLRRCNRQ